MPLQIELSVDELARLVEHTGMKSTFFNKLRNKQAKRATSVAKTIESPRKQQERNVLCAQKAAQRVTQQAEAEERRRQEQQLKDAARARQQIEEQRRAAAAAPETDEPNAVPARRMGPSRVPRSSAQPLPEIPLPGPAFVDVPTWESVKALALPDDASSIVDARGFVNRNIDCSVLCAPFPDGRIRTWTELKAPPPNSEFAEDWVSWLQPMTWESMVDNRHNGNRQHLTEVSKAGNYNEVLEVTALTPVTNPKAWPPQLRALGVEIEPETPLGDVLPKADYVIRMTRTDPFPSSSNEKAQVYRSMTREALVDELALALQAASQGVGPPIYAAVQWAWALQSAPEQMYGMIMIMRKADGNMVDWAFKLRRMPEYQHDPIRGPSPVLRGTVEQAACFLVELCFYIGSTQHINYDMKKGNLLVHEISGQFYMTDFDPMYYRYIPPEFADVKACFFVNLLLLAMHVRAYSESSTISNALLGVWTPILVELWDEALRKPQTFGPGRRWLKQARLERNKEFGNFDPSVLAHMEPGARIGEQLTMMVFEYLFDTDGKTPPRTVAEWNHWMLPESDYFNTGRKAYPLVPQLLRFACLNQREWPARLNPVFDATVEEAYRDAPEGSDGEAYSP